MFLPAFSLLLAVLSLTSPLARAAEPPAAPLLRIEPGEHVAIIKRIAAYPAGRWLVSASDDKTARVWDLAKGRLVSVLRFPIGAGNEGKLNSVAVSPDGRLVAVGGWTGYEWDKSNSIYLFDRASGRLVRRIADMPNVLNHLTFSPDGRVLAASIGGNAGLRLLDPENGRILARDEDYSGSSNSVHFRADGRRLVTTCNDGHVRLYHWEDGELRQLAKRAPPGGPVPFAARFSPDGRYIAVGFDDAKAVNLLDGEDLELVRALDTSNVDADLSKVAWSLDGSQLYAGGKSQRQVNGQWRQYIRRWTMQDGQPGAPLDWPAASNTIMELIPLPGEMLAFSSAMPEWGVLNSRGQRVHFHASSVADFRDGQSAFQLSYDAAQVRFGYELWGKSPAVFDIQTRSFLTGENLGLQGARQSAPGLELSNWKHTQSPKLNGQPLKLDRFETARSLAMRADGGGFVLGTEWNLRYFDSQGKQKWSQQVPGVVWSVNLSGDGLWVVAAYADGTLRWHRTDTGAEQLAFYPHPDKKRWVMWTPSGYFDASPGAEDLIGWHINRGKALAADFFPASRFRDRYNRPDVLTRVLETRDEAEALRLANAESGRRTQQASLLQTLPPVVRILSPAEGERLTQARVLLRYSARSADDAPLQAVKVLVDGRPLDQSRGLKPASNGEDYTLELTLPERDHTLSLIAENRHGSSEAATVRLTWAGAAKAPVYVAKPRLYVLAIGVSDYQDKALKLNYPAKDAQDFANALKGQAGLYRDVVPKVLANPTAADVLDGLNRLRAEVTARDVGGLFLAGQRETHAHGA